MKNIEIDKAIARFMGWQLDNSGMVKDRIWRRGLAVELDTTFKFSTDWDWLMPVYEKINGMESYSVKIENHYCCIYKFSTIESEAYCKSRPTMEAVYMCLGIWCLDKQS